MGSVTVTDWGRAISLARALEPGTTISVPKAAEPALPGGVDLRSANFPWSLHKGALRVYREDVAGDHLQIRAYPDHWTVERDGFNPQYRPVSHARNDVGPRAIAGLPAFATAQGLRLAGQAVGRSVALAETVTDAAMGLLAR